MSNGDDAVILSQYNAMIEQRYRYDLAAQERELRACFVDEPIFLQTLLALKFWPGRLDDLPEAFRARLRY